MNNCCKKVSLALCSSFVHRSFAVITLGILSLHWKWIKLSTRGPKLWLSSRMCKRFKWAGLVHFEFLHSEVKIFKLESTFDPWHLKKKDNFLYKADILESTPHGRAWCGMRDVVSVGVQSSFTSPESDMVRHSWWWQHFTGLFQIFHFVRGTPFFRGLTRTGRRTDWYLKLSE